MTAIAAFCENLRVLQVLAFLETSQDLTVIAQDRGRIRSKARVLVKVTQLTVEKRASLNHVRNQGQ